MGVLTDLSDITSRRTGYQSSNPENIFIYKTNSLPSTIRNTLGFRVASWYDLWFYDGQPTSGEVPTSTPTLCNNTTEGRIVITNPPEGQQKWLLNFNYTYPNTNGITILYDRLCHVGGLTVTSTTTQNINTPTLSRYSGTSSVGNRVILEILSATTISNPLTVEIEYTNQDGVANRTLTAQISTNGNYLRYVTQTSLPPLSSGDTGVRSVETFRVLSGTLGGGSGVVFGLAIIRPIEQSQSMLTSTNGFRDTIIGVPNVTEVLSGACLSLLFLNYTDLTTSLNNLTGSFGYVGFVNK